MKNSRSFLFYLGNIKIPSIAKWDKLPSFPTSADFFKFSFEHFLSLFFFFSFFFLQRSMWLDFWNQVHSFSIFQSKPQTYVNMSWVHLSKGSKGLPFNFILHFKQKSFLDHFKSQLSHYQLIRKQNGKIEVHTSMKNIFRLIMIDLSLTNLTVKIWFSVSVLFDFNFFYWDSLHARMNSHYNA